VYVVDASVWVSWFVPTDVFHLPSRSWFAARLHLGALLVIPVVALAEVAGAVARRSPDPALAMRAVSVLRVANYVRQVPIGSRLATQAAAVAADLRLRGADALYVALAQRLGVPLVTWDLEQKQRGGRVIAILNPQENA